MVELVLQKDISSPENAATIFKFEFKSQDSFILTYIQNNNVVTKFTWNREQR
jgi:hypothetical protein